MQREFQAFDNALRNQIFDVRHKVEIELKSIEERTEQIIAKYIAKLQTGTIKGGTGEKIMIGGGGISNLELDTIINTLKDEMKAYTERVVF
jgi:hypothetical protein